METSFQEHYASLSDEELLLIASSRAQLTEEATLAMDSEMARRGLSYQQARAQKRAVERLEVQEARVHRPKAKASKYFVSRRGVGWTLLAIVAPALFYVTLLFLFPSAYRIPLERYEPIFVMYTGAVLVCLSVQTWLMRTVRFWFSLTVSCIPQFFVCRWFSVYHPAHTRSGGKGIWFLSILAGYAVGAPLFLLLEKFKPKVEQPEEKLW